MVDYAGAQPETEQGRSTNGNNLGYRQKFNNYNWYYRFNNRSRYKKWSWDLAENFSTSMLQLGSGGDKWKDDQNLNFQFDYSLTPVFTLQSTVQSIIFQDNQSGLDNNVRSHVGRAGVKVTPIPRIVGSLQVGPKWERRLQQQDRGMSYSFQTIARRLRWADYDNNLNVRLNRDDFDTRKNHDFSATYFMLRDFTNGTRDSLNVFTSDRRLDNYTSVAGDIESYREKIKGLHNSLFYQIMDGWRMLLNSGLYFKNVQVLSSGPQIEKKQRTRNDQRISNELLFYYMHAWFRSHFSFSYWTQHQKYDIRTSQTTLPFSKKTAFVTPDNESSRLTLMNRFDVKVTPRDSAYTYFSVSRFQYDTPDTNNFDDRDEFRLNSRIAWRHRFSSGLRLDVQANANLYHMVYIFGERSADNNWNRIFRLEPSLTFKPVPRLSIRQSFEVLANYVDYDFEDTDVATKSFVFRKFAMDDSLRWHLTSRSLLSVDYRLQLEENGQLYWDKWSEIVLATRRKQWCHVTWQYSVDDKYRVAPGYTFYRREEWRHKTGPGGMDMREKHGTHISHGPILRFYYAPSEKILVYFDGVRYAVNSVGQKKYYTNNIELRVRWQF